MPPEPPANHCPQCGVPVATGALGGLCPACLLKQGAAADTITGGSAPFTPPTVEEVSAKFPQLEILSLIGKGGMGAVYKARQKQLDRFVALKILPPGIGGGGHDAAFAERFAREARALAKLSHPNIVTIHDFGQADGLFYLLMEFVDGMNLRQLLNTSRVSPREALAIVPQICDALQFAHDSGIVHRDIKPENILLDRLGRVKVADFGLAKLIGAENDPAAEGFVPAAGSVTEAGKIMGTPQYMAPEQRENPGEVDHRADIYALGVVFYQMLTGELPGKRIEAPSKKVRIDVRLDEVVLRAMEQKPELRYQQASMFKTQVETIAHTPQTVAPKEAAHETGSSAVAQEAILHARQELKIPAIGLIVLSAAGLLAALLGGILIVVKFAFTNRVVATQPQLTHLPVDFHLVLTLGALGLALGAVANGFILIAARRMLRLRGYTSAVCAAILVIAMSLGCFFLPVIIPGGLLAMGLGIWTLVVLNRRETKAAFDSGANDPAENPQRVSSPHFSLMAIIGACWIPFFFIALLMGFVPAGKVTHASSTSRPLPPDVVTMNPSSSSQTAVATQPPGNPFEKQYVQLSPAAATPGGNSSTAQPAGASAPGITVAPSAGPAMTYSEVHESGMSWLAVLLVVPLALAGFTAPFGTTILGCVAIPRIRRSSGRLYGLGLAVFDALFFPLLALDGLIAFFWTIVARIINSLAVSSYRSAAEDLFVQREKLALVAISILTVIVVDFLIIRGVWRTVNRPGDAAASKPAPRPTPPIAYLSLGLLLAGLIGAPLLLAVAPRGEDAIALFAGLSLLLAIILGFVSRSRLGRGVAIGCITVFVAFGAWIAYKHREVYDRESRLMQQDKERMPGNRSGTPVVEHIGSNHRSAMVHDDNVDLHYAIYYDGDFDSSGGTTSNTHSLLWLEDFGITLKNGRTFGYQRESVYADFFLKVNGRQFDFRQGRVFVLHDDGSVEQLALFPSLADARNVDKLAGLVAGARNPRVQPPAPQPPAQSLVYGLEVNGLQAATEPTPPDGRIALGGEVTLRYRVRNASDRDIVVAGRAFREDGNDSFIVEDSQGKRIPVNLSMVADTHTDVVWDVQSSVLESGETTIFKGAPLAFLPEGTAPETVQVPDLQYVLVKPGRYTLRKRLQFPDFPKEVHNGVMDWKGELETAPVTIEVGEAPPRFPAHIDSAGAVFGPVIEREVAEAIDFDSGRLGEIPGSVRENNPNDIAQLVLDSIAWLESEGFDAAKSGSASFLGLGMKASVLKNDAWEKMTVQQLSDTLQATGVKTSQKLNPDGNTPATYAFQTREGARGMLQVIAFTDTGVKLRYKLAQNPPPPAPDPLAVPVTVTNARKGNIHTYINALGNVAPTDVARPAPDTGKVLHNVNFVIPGTDAQAVVSKLKTKQPPWVEACDRNMNKIGEGPLASVADKIDPATGTLECNAVIVADAKTVLLPNAFLNIRMAVDDHAGVTVLPVGAVRQNERGSFVYLVKQDHTVTSRPVKTGGIDDGQTEITEGLSSGAVVVLDSTGNLREGASVSYKTEIKPDTYEIDFLAAKGGDVVAAVQNFVKAKKWAFKGGLNTSDATSTLDAVDAGGRHIVFKFTPRPADKMVLLITADPGAEMSATEIERQITPAVDYPPEATRVD